MRIIHLSDIHFDERRQLAGAVRVDDNGHNVALVSAAACLEHARKAAIEAGPVDLWVVTGDVFDTATPTQLEERYAIAFVDALAKDAPVVVLAGNHDVPAAGAGATALECLKLRLGVYVIEEPCVLTFRRGAMGGLLPSRLIGSGNGRVWGDPAPAVVALACLPYPRRAELVALVPEGSREERNAAASTVLRGLVQGLRVQAETHAPGAPIVALYHGTLDGATVGVQPRALSGDVTLSPADFGGFTYCAAGHIHKMQKMAPNAFYAGSPDRVDFDEERDFKGVLDVTINGTGPAAVKPIATPARTYVTAAPEHLDAPLDTWKRGVVYRVKAEVGPEEAVAIRRRVAEIAASGVWISASALRVVSDVRARDEEARADESVSAILARWLAANPHHVADVVTQHGGEAAATAAEVVTMNHGISGE